MADEDQKIADAAETAGVAGAAQPITETAPTDGQPSQQDGDAGQDDLANIADELAKEPAPPVDGEQEQAPAPAPETPPPAPALEPTAQDGLDADKAKESEPQPDIREEIRTQLAAHLETLRADVNRFLESEIRPLRDDIEAMGKAIDALDKSVAAASPEGAANLLADVQQTMADAKKVLADVQPILDRFPTLEAKIKHFL